MKEECRALKSSKDPQGALRNYEPGTLSKLRIMKGTVQNPKEFKNGILQNHKEREQTVRIIKP